MEHISKIKNMKKMIQKYSNSGQFTGGHILHHYICFLGPVYSWVSIKLYCSYNLNSYFII